MNKISFKTKTSSGKYITNVHMQNIAADPWKSCYDFI